MPRRRDSIDTAGWRIVAEYDASNGKSRHTVERNAAGEYRCTCQGFRIYKRGFCKHTKLAQLAATESSTRQRRWQAERAASPPPAPPARPTKPARSTKPARPAPPAPSTFVPAPIGRRRITFTDED